MRPRVNITPKSRGYHRLCPVDFENSAQRMTLLEEAQRLMAERDPMRCYVRNISQTSSINACIPTTVLWSDARVSKRLAIEDRVDMVTMLRP